ncbi:MAG: hypothetical protein KME30_04940 [Iphinoe sp. HA4291-MV1]|jgi:hypothetical protein|nr:hypothetical protein [Iphinoe sp. HA4291-MV1]
MLAKSLRFVKSTIATLSIVVFLTLLSVLGGTWFASMEASSAPLEESISCPPVVKDKIYRHIEGLDKCLTPLSDSEIEKLTDPFAKTLQGLLTQQKPLPDDTQTINQAIADKWGYGPTTYFVGEGAQIPTTVAARDLPRGLRYTITWGANENESKIMMAKLSPAIPETKTLGLIEVLSFDDQTKEYNYYFLRPQVPDFEASDKNPMVWAWTGHTSQAQQPQTIGQGCFRCHHNGVPVMREIELPWSNWQSQRANISAQFLPKEVASEAFFLSRRGAEILEQVIRSNFQGYYSNWLRQRIRKEGSTINVSDVDQMLRYLTTNTTVNFKSSDVQSAGQNTSPPDSDIAGVPPNDTFLSDTLLQTTLKLDYSPLSVKLPRKDYDAFLKEHDFKLVGTKGFTRDSEKAYESPGSTYFALYLPQVAAEDIYVTQKLLQSKVVTDRFVAALLMVDYKNPLFSEKRASLQKYAKGITTGKIVNGVSSVPTDFAAKIKEKGFKAPSNPEDFDASSPEEQFLYTWELPNDQWKQVTADRLKAYVKSVENLEPTERLDYVMRWSIEQRDRFASTPALCEFYESRLLFPENDLSELPSCPKPTASN